MYLTRQIDLDRLKLAFEEWGRVGRSALGGHRGEKQRMHDARDNEARPSTAHTEDQQRGYMNGAGTTTAGMV
jgi:hypothetical protein